MKTKTLLGSVAALSLGLLAGAAQASTVGLTGITVSPMIVAGSPGGVPPDSPAARVDPNVSTSPFSGVVSINIRYDGLSYICSGTLVSKRHVVSAGHCVDTNGLGTVIDISSPFATSGKDVRAVFNAGPGAGSAIVTASSVAMHSDYGGFGICPYPAPYQCLNDDVAVITLSEDAPDTAKIYKTYMAGVGEGQLVTMVGYGTSGTGDVGYTVSPSFRVKRTGQNYMDLFDLDDEQGFASGPQEVWYADFDGVRGGVMRDTWCDFYGVCTPILPNDVEAGIGGGDSGGPSFMLVGGEYYLVGNNTFGGAVGGPAGSFGSIFGGILMSGYYDFLRDSTGGTISFIPEPASAALVLSSLGLMGVFTRRRRNK